MGFIGPRLVTTSANKVNSVPTSLSGDGYTDRLELESTPSFSSSTTLLYTFNEWKSLQVSPINGKQTTVDSRLLSMVIQTIS